MAKRLDIVEENFLNTIKKYKMFDNKTRKNIIIGVSGGADSLSLLYLLNKYKEKFNINIIVCHVNHLIRNEAGEDEKFVEDFCKKINVKFYAKDIDVTKYAKENNIGTEEAGRKIRYDFFKEICDENNTNELFIAHNANDNAETVILNLIRGTGTKGLCGILPISKDKTRNLIIKRPLINSLKTDIIDYCNKNDLKFRTDSTNLENEYRRNYVRNVIIPEFSKVNPNIVKSIERTSQILREDDKSLSNYSKFFINENIKKINEYEKIENEFLDEFEIYETKAAKFRKLDDGIKSRVIIEVQNKYLNNSLNIRKDKIDEIVQISNKNVGNKFVKINNNYCIKFQNGKIYFELKTNKNKF